MSNGERFGGNKNHFMTVASADNRNVEKVSKGNSIISKKSKSSSGGGPGKRNSKKRDTSTSGSRLIRHNNNNQYLVGATS